MELRQLFVHDALRRVVPVTELCAAYGIRRKTGYKFRTRLVEARPVFERLFRTYGLPQRIRSDKGVPFATQALATLVARGVVDPARDSPRSHRAGLAPPERPSRNACIRHSNGSAPGRRRTQAQQQRCFDRWRQEYNTVRPHEALGDATPASRYAPSTRPYPTKSPALEYPGHYEVRGVSRNGGIRWHKQWVNVSQTLGEEYIGLVEIHDGEWDVYFGPLCLGRFPERTLTIEDALGRQYRRHY